MGNRALNVKNTGPTWAGSRVFVFREQAGRAGIGSPEGQTYAFDVTPTPSGRDLKTSQGSCISIPPPAQSIPNDAHVESTRCSVNDGKLEVDWKNKWRLALRYAYPCGVESGYAEPGR